MTDFPTFTDDELLLTQVEEAAIVLDEVSAKLLHSAEQMQSVMTMTEPVRADAIALAREILRKLKVKFGEAVIGEGLDINTALEANPLNALNIVAQTLEHLLAWGRGVDASIMSDPSVQAAISAIGQWGFIAKVESLRLAKKSRDMFLADSIRQRLDAINPRFKIPSAKRIGELLETIERGIDRVLNRVQDLGMSGAGVSHTQNPHGGFMNTTPIAGQSMQIGADGSRSRDAIGKRNIEAMIAEELAAQAQASRIAGQNAARSKQQGAAVPSRPAPGMGRQAVQQARAQQARISATTPTTVGSNLTAAQLARLTAARLAGLHHDDEEHHHLQQVQTQQQIQQRLTTMRNNAKRMATIHDHDHHEHDLHHVPLSTPQPEAHKPSAKQPSTKPTAPITADLLKGVNIGSFDMSGVKGEAVATSNREYFKQQQAGLVPQANPHDPHKNGIVR